MQKSTIISAVLVLLILILGVVTWAFTRGILYFEGGMPKFSKEQLVNPAPSLDRATMYPEHFTEEAKTLYEQKVAAVKTTLTEDPKNFDAWLDLAIYYRMVNDNEAAAEIWEYLRKLYPEDAISRHNLGEYYFHTEKNYAKAEQYYRESIAIMPGLQSNYTDLYEMYRYVYKQDTTAAVDILKQGAEIGGPSAIQFKIMLGRHYRDVLGDKENARKYLTEARDAAQAAGDRSIANDLTREISSL